MRIFLYEFVTGGGWYTHADKPAPESLLAEGRAMLTALVADFAALEDVAVEIFRDNRYPLPEVPGVNSPPDQQRRSGTNRAAPPGPQADWTVLIAPEFRRSLAGSRPPVERARRLLLSFVASRGAGHRQARHGRALARHGVPVTRGMALAPGEPLPVDFAYPAVLKPRDGAGSLDIEWLPYERRTAQRLGGHAAGSLSAPAWRPAWPCCAVRTRSCRWSPCLQRLAGDGSFAYLGGSLPLEPQLAARARRWRCARSLPCRGSRLSGGRSGSGRRSGRQRRRGHRNQSAADDFLCRIAGHSLTIWRGP